MVLLCRGYPLAEALECGLRLRGWDTILVGQSSDPSVRGARLTVLVEDEDGALPASAGPGRVVAVAGIGAVDALLSAVSAGGTAVNAHLPFRFLLAEVHAALSVAAPTPAQCRRSLADLRARAAAARRFWTLTERERAILFDIAAGLRADVIAQRHTVSLATVRSQIASVLHKLGVRSQTAAVALVLTACPDRRVTDPLWKLHQNYQ